MNDPLSPLVVPPPRYLLESDSSDEEGQGEYPHPHPEQSSSRRQPPRPKIRVKRSIAFIDARAAAGSASAFASASASTEDEREEVVIGLNQVGRYLLKITGSQGSQAQGEIKVDADVIGSTRTLTEGATLVSLDESDLSGEEPWDIVRLLKDKIKAKRWTVLTSHVPSMYIPSPGESSSHGRHRGEPPIRVFSTGSSSKIGDNDGTGVYTFDAPNYLTGVAAGLVSLSAHPTASSPQPTVLILPLPLSSIPIPTVTQALTSSAPSTTVSAIVDSITKQASVTAGQGRREKSHWTEDDDEPFSAFGMGKVKGAKRDVGEAASMYT
ncbi:hypothetical protein I316_00388 [Kwoniella heveanensis BCC8398]|uniref:Uncharacterized protein n=1 Tax=Kwoniella heveanensis BCC8398 TaxID=1296120 RepID=A0A1B9H4G6_9TREE|nr:hypothetical protein I316_00388 [Kwoniella heveanensis BCC8398]